MKAEQFSPEADVLAIKRSTLFKEQLNMEPFAPWIKEHPLYKVKNPVTGRKEPTRYLPVDKIELSLDKLLLAWKWEILQVSQMFDSIVVTGRLHYFNHAVNEWHYHDGTGAAAVYSKQGADGDIEYGGGAVQKAVPAAASYALKDAADHLGKFFGRDLNRADSPVYSEKPATSDVDITGSGASHAEVAMVDTAPARAARVNKPAVPETPVDQKKQALSDLDDIEL